MRKLQTPTSKLQRSSNVQIGMNTDRRRSGGVTKNVCGQLTNTIDRFLTTDDTDEHGFFTEATKGTGAETANKR